jgi:hypothetical protein
MVLLIINNTNIESGSRQDKKKSDYPAGFRASLVKKHTYRMFYTCRNLVSV